MSASQTRSIKPTCSFCCMTAWSGRPFAMLSLSLTSPAATKRLSLWLARPQQRSPMPCLGSTDGDHWSGPSFSRLTRGESSWARSARFWRNIEYLFDVRVLISIGTMALQNNGTGPWLRGCLGTGMLRRWASLQVKSRLSGWLGYLAS